MIILRPSGITRGGRKRSPMYLEWLHNGFSGTVFQAMVLRPDLWVILSFFFSFLLLMLNSMLGKQAGDRLERNSLRSTPPSLTLY